LKKRIIRDGVEMFWCYDCQGYNLRENMTQNKANKFGIGTYCRKHDYEHKRKHPQKNKKKESYQIDHRVDNARKYYFKGTKRIKSVSIRPRTTGICVNWGKIRYERRGFIDGI